MGSTKALELIQAAKERQSTSLHLYNLRLESIPEELGDLEQLKELFISKHRLKAFPKVICQLKNLEKLQMGSCGIETLPAEIGSLKKLRTLRLFQNKFKELPAEIGQLSELEYLDVSGNRLESLSEQVGSLEKLQEINASNNRLIDLPATFSQLIALKKLDLSSNQMRNIPPALPVLQQLYLNYNSLEAGDLDFRQFPKLKILDLSVNHLTEIPHSLMELEHLATLHLDRNKLRELPVQLDQFEKLRYLSLVQNELQDIPHTISQIPRLQKLDLSENPDLQIPKEIVAEGLDAILNYLSSLEQSQETDYLYEAKLVLVGRGFAGKTCLSRKLIDPSYSLEREVASTEGIDIGLWDMTMRNGKSFRFNIWDFAGQEKYDATHQFFITERSVYIFVTEARQESNYLDFDYWLNVLKLLSNDSPVIVVQSKIDQRKQDLPALKYKSYFPNIVDFEYISCAEGYTHTLDALKLHIQKAIERLPQVGDKLPKAWVSIRTELYRLKDQEGLDHISYRDYLGICEGFGLDQDRADFLSNYFHHLGVIVHHRHERHLKNLVIVNPDWAVDGVYAILDHEKVQAQKGRFSELDLEAICDNERYRYHSGEILDLMLKYELCFELDGSHPSTFIAPTLLPADQALDSPNLSGEGSLQFFYRFKFMPAGLLSRFIVKLHQEIERNYFWRFGAILNFKSYTDWNCQAEVIEEYAERKIIIRVQGDESKQGLSLIRKTFREIFQQFELLEYTEMVPCNCRSCTDSTVPYFYAYDSLMRRLDNDKLTVECDNSYETLQINSLLEGIDYRIDGSKLISLLEDNRFEEALDFLKQMPDTRDEAVLLLGRFNQLNQQKMAGVIEGTEIAIQENKMRTEMLRLIQRK